MNLASPVTAFALTTLFLAATSEPSFADASAPGPTTVTEPAGASAFYNLETDSLGGGVDEATIQQHIRDLGNDPLYKITDSDDEAAQKVKTDALNVAVTSYLQSVGANAPCAQQLDDVAFGLDVASAAVDLAGLLVEIGGAAEFFTDFEIPGLVIQSVGAGLNIGGIVVEGIQNGQPNCNAEFTGTIKGQATIAAKMGITAHDGKITLGAPDGVNFSQGITLGGGSLAGAGFGGAQAFTGDPDAIAIGNGASAFNAGDLALGSSASASGGNATAIGSGAAATGVGATAVGNGATASAASASAFGDGATASGIGATAVGSGSTASALSASAFGDGAKASATSASAFGDAAVASAGAATALGAGSTASGVGAVAVGDASATNTNAVAMGTGASATGVGSIAIGAGASATGSIAMGAGASAANGGAAYGDASHATGFHATAVGNGATATLSNSAAFGNGAHATLVDQQVFGTASNTYTMPGITSPESEGRLITRKELVETDLFGNLAGDNGALFTAMAKAQAGISVALAAEAPSLTAEEKFGLRMGYGNYNGRANGMAASAIGVLCRDCLRDKDRLAIDASIGAGWSEYEGYGSDTVVGGRVGVQWTW